MKDKQSLRLQQYKLMLYKVVHLNNADGFATSKREPMATSPRAIPVEFKPLKHYV